MANGVLPHERQARLTNGEIDSASPKRPLALQLQPNTQEGYRHAKQL